jgi:hypothetical protein
VRQQRQQIVVGASQFNFAQHNAWMISPDSASPNSKLRWRADRRNQRRSMIADPGG